MAIHPDPHAVRAEFIARLPKVRGVLRLGLVLAAIIAGATAASWTIAYVALRPLCEAHAEKRHLVHDGMTLSFFTRGNRVTPCRFRAPPTGAFPSGAPSEVVRWRSLEGATFLLQIAVRPDLMSYILGGLGLAGWLFLSPAGRALRRNRPQ